MNHRRWKECSSTT